MAHSIGFYAARTYLRVQSITHTAHEKADQLDQLKAERTKPSGQSAHPSEQESGQATAQAEKPNQLATRRAEEMVDYLAQHLSSLTATVKLNFQITAARVREDAEDIWAEAQTIRQHIH